MSKASTSEINYHRGDLLNGFIREKNKSLGFPLCKECINKLCLSCISKILYFNAITFNETNIEGKIVINKACEKRLCIKCLLNILQFLDLL